MDGRQPTSGRIRLLGSAFALALLGCVAGPDAAAALLGGSSLLDAGVGVVEGAALFACAGSWRRNRPGRDHPIDTACAAPWVSLELDPAGIV